jgi:hypothetical protein
MNHSPDSKVVGAFWTVGLFIRKWRRSVTASVVAVVALVACLWFVEATTSVLLTHHYLYQSDTTNSAAKSVIEVTSTKGFFQTSTRNRIVKFYSPYCVRNPSTKPDRHATPEELTTCFFFFVTLPMKQGHCVTFKEKYMTVAQQARKRYGYRHLEFYGVSCAGVPDLCERYNIVGYPTVFAVGAGSYNLTRQMDVLSFSVEAVEKALNLT